MEILRVQCPKCGWISEVAAESRPGYPCNRRRPDTNSPYCDGVLRGFAVPERDVFWHGLHGRILEFLAKLEEIEHRGGLAGLPGPDELRRDVLATGLRVARDRLAKLLPEPRPCRDNCGSR
jgi:hypothetical protein